MWLALYFIGRFKLLISIRIASTLVFLGALTRALSTLPLQSYDKAVPRQVQFWITFVGQVRIQYPRLKTSLTIEKSCYTHIIESSSTSCYNITLGIHAGGHYIFVNILPVDTFNLVSLKLQPDELECSWQVFSCRRLQ